MLWFHYIHMFVSVSAQNVSAQKVSDHKVSKIDNMGQNDQIFIQTLFTVHHRIHYMKMDHEF